ncbi:hypothetical protein WDW89_12620 [Deltaproteobacteria bacterium TL4]
MLERHETQLCIWSKIEAVGIHDSMGCISNMTGDTFLRIIEKLYTMQTSGNIPISTIKQNSTQSQKTVGIGPIRGKINPQDIQIIPGVYKVHNIWNAEIQRRVTEIEKWSKMSTQDKTSSQTMRHIEPYEKNQIAGIALQKYLDTPDNRAHIRGLLKNPYSIFDRLALVESVELEHDLPIELYRENLFQAIIPLVMGYCSTKSWNLFIRVYLTYLEKMKQLVQESLVASKPGENQTEGSQLQIILKLLTTFKELALSKDVQKLEITTFHLSDLNNTLQDAALIRQKMNDPDSVELFDKKNIINELGKLLNAMRFIPLLHPFVIEITRQLKAKYPSYLLSYIFAGRVYMQAMGIAVIIHANGQKGYLQLLKNNLMICLETYGQGKKFLGSSVSKQGAILLKEYAILALHAYNLRATLKIPKDVTLTILTMGIKNLERLETSDPEYTKLNANLREALISI